MNNDFLNPILSTYIPGMTSTTGSCGVGKLSYEFWNSEVLRINEAESGVGASWLSIITEAGPDWDSRLKLNLKKNSNKNL